MTAAFNITLTGMGFVIGFLVVFLLMTQLMSALIQKLERAKQAQALVLARASATMTEETKFVIKNAVEQHIKNV